jgi:hypothetical protein
MAENPEKGKTKVIYNRGVRSIKYFHDKSGKQHKWLDPGESVELPIEKANQLLNYEGIVDIAKVPKVVGMDDIQKELEIKEEQAVKLKAEIDGLLKKVEAQEKEIKKLKKEN